MMKKIMKKIGGEKNLGPGVKESLKKCVPDSKVVMGRAHRGIFAGRHIQFGNRFSEDGGNKYTFPRSRGFGIQLEFLAFDAMFPEKQTNKPPIKMTTDCAVNTDRFKNFFNQLETRKTLLTTITQLHKTLTDHFSSLEQSLSQKSKTLDSQIEAFDANTKQTLESLQNHENSIPE
ncbi:FRIGIDA-like protein 4a [Camellia lanceoleosa]|uniref:FRIGIDA-like protein 4a n=1 Tax=Camellia lanceoleosa TaxID=1840588 RepID=A0ACC0FW62_9ERIC|nr:FRIGIDA-like protein 4a [Camellia lanceoleosa]